MKNIYCNNERAHLATVTGIEYGRKKHQLLSLINWMPQIGFNYTYNFMKTR